MGSLIKADAPERECLESLGLYLMAARFQRGLSQLELAEKSGLSQTQISYFEVGQRRPSIEQLVRMARALDVSVQKLIGGSERPGTELPDIAIELRHLGVVDLWVKDALVPGAFRRPEELVALVVAPEEPDPRILEAVPAILAWNGLDPILLRAYGLTKDSRTARRLAWLADVTLAIDKQSGFPGGCRTDALACFTRLVSPPLTDRDDWDSLGFQWQSYRHPLSGNDGGSPTTQTWTSSESGPNTWMNFAHVRVLSNLLLLPDGGSGNEVGHETRRHRGLPQGY